VAGWTSINNLVKRGGRHCRHNRLDFHRRVTAPTDYGHIKVVRFLTLILKRHCSPRAFLYRLDCAVSSNQGGVCIKLTSRLAEFSNCGTSAPGSWRDPADESPAQVKGSAGLVASVAPWEAIRERSFCARSSLSSFLGLAPFPPFGSFPGILIAGMGSEHAMSRAKRAPKGAR
jgi:hypothetical protein